MLTSKPHHAAVISQVQRPGLDNPTALHHYHKISTCVPLRSRRRPHHTRVGAQRDGGYGRFSDTDDEPSFRPSPSPSVARAWAGRPGREWQEIGNADVLVPKDVEYPLGVVHFVGGQGVGVFPRSAYGALLEGLVDAGIYGVYVSGGFRFCFVFGLLCDCVFGWCLSLCGIGDRVAR